jgi:hypothetical protein
MALHDYLDNVYSLNDNQPTYTLGVSSTGTSGAGISSGTSITVPWVTTSGTSNTYTVNPNWNNGTSGKIQLDGPGGKIQLDGPGGKIQLDGPEADIEINGESLIAMLRRIEERLNILTPNPELESEWTELRELGDQYRKLEQYIKDKQATWDRLQATNQTEID